MGLLSDIGDSITRAFGIGGVPADLAAVLGYELQVITGGRPPRRGTGELIEAYRKMPWLHATVRRRAEAVGGVEWELYRRVKAKPPRGLRSGEHATRSKAIGLGLQAGTLERVHEHPLLDLLARPNPAMTGRSFWELTNKHQDLVGESFWAMDSDDRGRRVLWAVPPSQVLNTPTMRDPVYQVRTAEGTLRIPAGDMIWIRQHDPNDPYRGRGTGVAQALTDELQTDEYFAELGMAYGYNGSMPAALVELQGAKQDQIDKFKALWDAKNRGPQKAGRTHFTSTASKVHMLGRNMVESDYIAARQMFRDFCLQVFGTPPEMLGVLENANRSTIDAAEVLFARYSTLPALERYCSELECWVVPHFGRDLVLGFPSPVPDDVEAQRKMMVALPGAFKVDEIRARAGEDPLPDGQGQQLMTAPGAPRIPVEETPQGAKPGLVPVSDDDDPKEIAA